MKKFIIKVLTKIIRSSLKEEIQELERKSKELDVRIEEVKKHAYHFTQMLEGIGVSVDVHEYGPVKRSWAVISIQGQRSDFIKFVDLKDNDIRDIHNFLKNFERDTSLTIDASPGTSRFLKIAQKENGREYR